MQFHYYKERKIGHQPYWTDQYESRRYRYQWAERRQTVQRHPNHGWAQFEPEYRQGQSQNLIITIPTEPTSPQLESIAQGERNLPYNLITDSGDQVGCEVISRGNVGDQFFQIINHVEVVVQLLSGLSMLQANKQALAECSAVLYGENTFAFTTGLKGPLRYQSVVHLHDEFRHFPHWIPGRPNKNGAPQTQRQLNKAINRMFVHDGFLPKFVGRDPMLQFFHRIGHANASLLTKVKIEGRMKTVYNTLPNELLDNEPIGFGRILDILTIVLKNVCPNLRELTLHMEDRIQNTNSKDRMRWDNDPYDRLRKSDEQRIDEVVGKVVNTLDSLKALALVGQYPSISAFVDEWGRSARWINIVKERTKKREAAEAKAKHARTLCAGSEVV